MKTAMLAQLVKKPFDQEGWIFEIKWDGYRALAYKDKQIKLLSRNKKSFNERFSTIVNELKRLPGHFVIDGEIVILDKNKKSSFQLLQNYQKTKKGTPYYYLFDILSYQNKNLASLPLIERKKILKALLNTVKLPHLRYSSHVQTKGTAFFQKAVKLGLEGIMAKKADSHYQSGRSRDWLKIKTGMRQEVVIGGFTEPKGSRTGFGALLVGVYEKKALRYAGHVGGGFNRTLLKGIYQQLQKIRSKNCPFSTKPKPNAPVTWVKPRLVCEVSFTEWTSEGMMRHPIFKGLRIDKPAKEVVREKYR